MTKTEFSFMIEIFHQSVSRLFNIKLDSKILGEFENFTDQLFFNASDFNTMKILPISQIRK